MTNLQKGCSPQFLLLVQPDFSRWPDGLQGSPAPNDLSCLRLAKVRGFAIVGLLASDVGPGPASECLPVLCALTLQVGDAFPSKVVASAKLSNARGED